MAPQEYVDLTRHLAAICARQLTWIVEHDPTTLPRTLALDGALQQVNARALLTFCTQLEARYMPPPDSGFVADTPP